MSNTLKTFLGLSYSQKLIYIRKALARIKTVTIYKLMFSQIGWRSYIIRPLFITPEFISMGDRVKVWHDSRIEGIDKYGDSHFLPKIVIEDRVEIQQRVHITFIGNLKIGECTSILPDVLITDIDHIYEDIENHPGEQGINCKPTSIGKYCSIGAGSKLLAGCTLGNNCIVGANSVVKGNFPDGSIIAGSPARIIKRNDYSSRKWT